MIAALWFVAALASDPTIPVRVHARPEIPWVVAVVAADAPALPDDADALHALSAAGGSARFEDGVVVVEGPPDADDQVLAFAKLAAKNERAAIFVEGRTKATSTRGALPRLARSHARLDGPELAPTPGLFDVEGAALLVFLADLGVHASLEAAPGRAALVVDPHDATTVDKELLAGAVANPLPQKNVDSLRSRAVALVDEHRSRVGAWAKDAALMWLSSSSIEPDEPVDLGSRIRARIFPDAIVRVR